MDDVVKLLTEVISVDEDFNNVADYKARLVYCKVRSIGMNEFYSAGQAGLNPAYVIEVFSGNYNGEKIVEYKGVRYSVYRTYRKLDTDTTELYIEDKAGVTDGNVD